MTSNPPSAPASTSVARSSDPSPLPLEGGCLCGAGRYRISAKPRHADYCHCRMCQRSTGAPVVPWLTVASEAFAWTTGEPAVFRSSSAAERGFCARCGTPLTFRYLAKHRINVALGSLDEPAKVRPTLQHGIESRVPWWRELFELPGQTTAQDPPPGGLEAMEKYQDRQGAR